MLKPDRDEAHALAAATLQVRWPDATITIERDDFRAGVRVSIGRLTIQTCLYPEGWLADVQRKSHPGFGRAQDYPTVELACDAALKNLVRDTAGRLRREQAEALAVTEQAEAMLAAIEPQAANPST